MTIFVIGAFKCDGWGPKLANIPLHTSYTSTLMQFPKGILLCLLEQCCPISFTSRHTRMNCKSCYKVKGSSIFAGKEPMGGPPEYQATQFCLWTYCFFYLESPSSSLLLISFSSQPLASFRKPLGWHISQVSPLISQGWGRWYSHGISGLNPHLSFPHTITFYLAVWTIKILRKGTVLFILWFW